ncbi:hypothetical protein T01_10279 [Trichinella spiralis]|uniref:Uncharacterized protein n=1 Tax=Trichinella spiralis TaxID=6334 RepID=A0A0V1BBA8_TRISP|nr:hypothetical protein T01_10279 [Trichinella spiralis]
MDRSAPAILTTDNKIDCQCKRTYTTTSMRLELSQQTLSARQYLSEKSIRDSSKWIRAKIFDRQLKVQHGKRDVPRVSAIITCRRALQLRAI